MDEAPKPKVSRKIVINGKEYDSVEEMPPEIRAVYEKMSSMMVDEDADGVPDFIQGKGPAGLWSAAKQAWQVAREANAAGIRSVELPGGEGTRKVGSGLAGPSANRSASPAGEGRSAPPPAMPAGPQAVGSFSVGKLIAAIAAAALAVYLLRELGVLG